MLSTLLVVGGRVYENCVGFGVSQEWAIYAFDDGQGSRGSPSTAGAPLPPAAVLWLRALDARATRRLTEAVRRLLHDLVEQEYLLTMHRDLAPHILILAALLAGCGTPAAEESNLAALGERCTEVHPCGPDLFCAEEYHWCSADGEYRSTQCVSRDVACEGAHPVCGCDDKVYESECAAHAAGVDIGGASAGEEYCPHDLTPAGTFACGPYFCDAVTEYCRYGDGDTSDRETACQPIPDTCTMVSCACFPDDFTHKCKTVPGNGVTGFLYLEIWQ